MYIYVRFEKPPRKDLRVRDVLAQRTASTRDASLVQSNFHVFVTSPFFFSSIFFFSLLILEGEGGSEIRAKKKGMLGEKKRRKKRGIAATSDMFVSFVLYCRRERKDGE